MEKLLDNLDLSNTYTWNRHNTKQLGEKNHVSKLPTEEKNTQKRKENIQRRMKIIQLSTKIRPEKYKCSKIKGILEILETKISKIRNMETKLRTTTRNFN